MGSPSWDLAEALCPCPHCTVGYMRVNATTTLLLPCALLKTAFFVLILTRFFSIVCPHAPPHLKGQRERKVWLCATRQKRFVSQIARLSHLFSAVFRIPRILKWVVNCLNSVETCTTLSALAWANSTPENILVGIFCFFLWTSLSPLGVLLFLLLRFQYHCPC